MHLTGRRRLWRDHLWGVNFDVLFVPARRDVRKLGVEQGGDHHEL